MRRSRSRLSWPRLTLRDVAVAAAPAQAYIGPGAGITMLGALWGVVVAVALAIGAVLFWPIRLLMRKFRKPAAPPATGRRPRQGVLSHHLPFLSVLVSICTEAPASHRCQRSPSTADILQAGDLAIVTKSSTADADARDAPLARCAGRLHRPDGRLLAEARRSREQRAPRAARRDRDRSAVLRRRASPAPAAPSCSSCWPAGRASRRIATATSRRSTRRCSGTVPSRQVYRSDAPPAERAHKDRILVTPDSPEAMEEVLWMRFFPAVHDEAASQVLDAATSNAGVRALLHAII